MFQSYCVGIRREISYIRAEDQDLRWKTQKRNRRELQNVNTPRYSLGQERSYDQKLKKLLNGTLAISLLTQANYIEKMPCTNEVNSKPGAVQLSASGFTWKQRLRTQRKEFGLQKKLNRYVCFETSWWSCCNFIQLHCGELKQKMDVCDSSLHYLLLDTLC